MDCLADAGFLWGNASVIAVMVSDMRKYSVHHTFQAIIYENDQQDAAVYDNLLFLGCSTCFERYFRSSSGASKLCYSFWYYTRMLLPAGIMGVLECVPTLP